MFGGQVVGIEIAPPQRRDQANAEAKVDDQPEIEGAVAESIADGNDRRRAR
jgi:hypothetical protein